MKHIKIFEDFFKFYQYSQVTKTSQVWGYTREEIEDFFIHFVDELNLSISIDFIFKSGTGYTYTTNDSDIESYLNDIKYSNLTPVIEVNLYLSIDILREMGVGGDSIIYTNDDSPIGKRFKDSLTKLLERIETMMAPIKSGRIRGYDIKYYNNSNRIPYISNRYDTSNDGVDYGSCIYQLILIKKK